MKKSFILIALIFSTLAGFSQTLEDIKEMINKKDFANAKTSIDKYLADEKNIAKADGWYFKGRVYNAYSYEKSAPPAEVQNLKNTAFEAFKKSQQLDPKDTWLKLENYSSYLDLYFGLYDHGATLFNAKDYEGAYNAFKKSLEVKDFILAKQYSYPQATLHPLDTALVLNTAIAATQAKKVDEAVSYYKKLTDAGISGDQYKEVYEYLVEYYNKKEDAAALAQILDKAKKLYPTNNYWNEIELNNISKNGDQVALFAKYDEMMAKDPKNFALAYNYAVELYNKNYGKDAKQTDDVILKDKLTEVIKVAIDNDPGIEATVLMANHTYNMASDYITAASLIKGTKPDDVKKKADIKALSNKKMDECILYSDKAVKYFESKMSELKPVQIANYKIVLGYLSDIYNLKGDAKKSAEYDKKRSAVK